VLKFYFKAAMKARTYTNFAKNSDRFLLILPQLENDYMNSLQVIDSLLKEKKKVSIVIKDLKVNHLLSQYKVDYIDFGTKDILRFDLPSKKLVQALKEKTYDVVIDLNMGENIFSGIIANLCLSNYRIGFKKENSDKFYNIQIINNESNSAISYRNLLNSLQMF
jgi:hypothetical protein